MLNTSEDWKKITKQLQNKKQIFDIKIHKKKYKKMHFIAIRTNVSNWQLKHTNWNIMETEH